MRTAVVILVVALGGCGGADGPRPEATSLLGTPLYRPAMDDDTRADREAELATARAAYDADDTDAEAIIWLGRRTAYLGRYGEAIDIFSRGISLHPDDARMYRHRGHRYITVRKLEPAIADLRRAADLREGKQDIVEQDGLPNAQGVPLSTLHTNIYYHLGLAHYLRGELDDALAAYRECMSASANDDMVVATAYWLYLTLRRGDHDEDAAALLDTIDADMMLIENASYHELLLLFKGERTVDQVLGDNTGDGIADATVGYGVAQSYALTGRRDDAGRALERVVAGEQWAAFGYIAAEADLSR